MKTRLASLVFSMQRLGCVDSMYMFIGHNNEARSLLVTLRTNSYHASCFHRAYDQLSNYFADQVSIQHQEAEQARKAHNREVASYRAENQLQSTRKEWDLNRPDAKLIDTPARVGDDDSRLGTASMQKFSGEDLSVSLKTSFVQHPHLSHKPCLPSGWRSQGCSD